MNNIASTILQLLGGARFSTMVNAFEMNYTNNALHFKFCSGTKNKANHCSITLQSTDTYIVEFHRITGLTTQYIGTFKDVHANELKVVFSRETGLVINL